MSKEIWLGPVLGNNRERLLARCAELVSTGQSDRLLYIAASHPLLDLVTERLLDGTRTHGVWGEFPVYLFRGFVRRVLTSAVDEETGSLLAPRVAIDRDELPLRRSLVSQILKQLAVAGKIPAIKPLAGRAGCINTIASLIGEIQRAGKTPEEFLEVIEERDDGSQVQSPKTQVQSPKPKVSSSKSQALPVRLQLDFDREVALIYEAYSDALGRFGLTDQDADQLRALKILYGEVDGRRVSLPWLERVELLVLDGFFDFTPVQGDMLRRLIPGIPNVIVNLNDDDRNEEIFRPFRTTVEQLESIGGFETKRNSEVVAVSRALTTLRERLFNSGEGGSPIKTQGSGAGRMPALPANGSIELFECSDRDTEIRTIAKEIKRLILNEGSKLSDIALVVRERAAYAETILRVCAEESIPCSLERRIDALDVPAVRACAKLFQILKEPAREQFNDPKVNELADLLKTDYFRLSPQVLDTLAADFDVKFARLLQKNDPDLAVTEAGVSQRDLELRRAERLRRDLGIGDWAPDLLENVIAYVGSELRVKQWLERARRLIDVSPEAARQLFAGTENDGDIPAAEEKSAEDEAKEKRKRPSPIHPAAIAWTALVLEHLQELIADLPEDGEPEVLRAAVRSLLDQLEFASQARQPFQRSASHTDVPQAALDIRGLECLRRAFAAAVRSFDLAEQVVSDARMPSLISAPPSFTIGLLMATRLTNFVDEVERSLHSQALVVGPGSRDGLSVLEATDVRGLRFRTVFIAGLIEGGFPLRMSGDWLYPHEERERLKRHGVVLEDISSDTLLKEEHYFYQSACRATERLYLTRPLVVSDGSETVASYYVEELKRAVSPAEIETKQIRSDADTLDIMQASTTSELTIALVRQSEKRAHSPTNKTGLPRTQVDDLLSRAELHGFLSDSALRRVDIERARAGASFGPFDGEITNRDLRALLGQHFGPEHVYSASALSTYGNCGFRFFAGRVMRLEPRNEAALDLQAIDAGKLLHDVLRRFFEGHRKQYLPSLDRDELRRELAKVADTVFDEHERLVPPLNQRIWKIDSEIRKLILDQVLLFELRLQKRTDERGIRPTYFELAFGRASDASDPSSSQTFLKLERPGDGGPETALVQGQIDRVDVNERERVAVAYDYKMSYAPKRTDLEAGREMQIPIYLAALEQLFLPGFQLAGGGYYKLRTRGPRLNQGLYRRMFADCTDATKATQVDDNEWRQIRAEVTRRVWQFIDNMRAGDFRVKPSLGKETCRFCDFPAVCRYDTYRISRKR